MARVSLHHPSRRSPSPERVGTGASNCHLGSGSRARRPANQARGAQIGDLQATSNAASSGSWPSELGRHRRRGRLLRSGAPRRGVPLHRGRRAPSSTSSARLFRSADATASTGCRHTARFPARRHSHRAGLCPRNRQVLLDPRPREVLLLVVDHGVGPETSDQIHVVRARGRRHGRAGVLRQLEGKSGSSRASANRRRSASPIEGYATSTQTSINPHLQGFW